MCEAAKVLAHSLSNVSLKTTETENLMPATFVYTFILAAVYLSRKLLKETAKG